MHQTANPFWKTAQAVSPSGEARRLGGRAMAQGLASGAGLLFLVQNSFHPQTPVAPPGTMRPQRVWLSCWGRRWWTGVSSYPPRAPGNAGSCIQEGAWKPSCRADISFPLSTQGRGGPRGRWVPCCCPVQTLWFGHERPGRKCVYESREVGRMVLLRPTLNLRLRPLSSTFQALTGCFSGKNRRQGLGSSVPSPPMTDMIAL